MILLSWDVKFSTVVVKALELAVLV